MADRIRLATSEDGPALAAIYRPAVTDSVISFELVPPDATVMAERVTRVLALTPWLVLERDGRVAGYAYAGKHSERPAYDWSVDVSVYVEGTAHRGGIARALYASLFAILVLQGFRNAYAGITLPNAPSVGFHRSQGFTIVGVYRGVGWKMGAWHDVAWYERSLAPRVSDPPRPRPIGQCTSDPAFPAALRTGVASRCVPPLPESPSRDPT
jgi:phosphinothricin acetyltransferase